MIRLRIHMFNSLERTYVLGAKLLGGETELDVPQ